MITQSFTFGGIWWRQKLLRNLTLMFDEVTENFVGLFYLKGFVLLVLKVVAATQLRIALTYAQKDF